MSDPFSRLRAHTSARIGLGRFGAALPTKRLLEFQRAHAEARVAVWHPWDVSALEASLTAMKERVLSVSSQTDTRAEFLRRPDLGRRLSASSEKQLRAGGESRAELAFVLSDGLSALAVERHFLPLWQTLRPMLTDFAVAPLVLAPYGRVALADEVGEILGVALTVIFIGERPGLSASDSLGIYLTYSPRVGNHDAMRNCISNVRPPQGLDYGAAAHKLIYLIRESLRLKFSGVDLKENALLTS